MGFLGKLFGTRRVDEDMDDEVEEKKDRTERCTDCGKILPGEDGYECQCGKAVCEDCAQEGSEGDMFCEKCYDKLPDADDEDEDDTEDTEEDDEEKYAGTCVDCEKEFDDGYECSECEDDVCTECGDKQLDTEDNVYCKECYGELEDE